MQKRRFPSFIDTSVMRTRMFARPFLITAGVSGSISYSSSSSSSSSRSHATHDGPASARDQQIVFRAGRGRILIRQRKTQLHVVPARVWEGRRQPRHSNAAYPPVRIFS
jgi:hypothetical protein